MQGNGKMNLTEENSRGYRPERTRKTPKSWYADSWTRRSGHWSLAPYCEASFCSRLAT